MKELYEKLQRSSMNSVILSFAMLCVGVEPSKDGPILFLMEPFMSLRTKPLTKTPLERAKSWINRMLIVDLTLTADSFDRKEFEVNRVQSLTITYKGKIDLEGKEHPFKCGDIMERRLFSNFSLTSTSIRCDKSDLIPYKDCVGRDECIAALDEIEEIYLKKCLIPPYRQNKTTLWIRFECEAMGIFYYNNRLEIVYEPKEDITSLYKPDGSLDWIKNFEVYMYSFNRTEFLTVDKKIKRIKEDECMVKSCSDLIKIYKN